MQALLRNRIFWVIAALVGAGIVVALVVAVGGSGGSGGY